ncbi:MAG: tetratricopeptide repeat protein [Proteobacteria bacterium]|nr:tetratricopeptide repeat protein [Pseudomonadota bacterium]
MINWLRKKENREILSWVGGGLVVIVSGLWALYTHFDKPSQTSPPTPAPITTGDIHSRGDTLVGSGIIDKRSYNYSGLTDIELAKQMGVAEAAVKNFFKILDQKHIPIAEWDNTLRQLAERYKELQKRAVLLESEDPEVRSLQDDAKQAIDAAEFEKAEALLAEAVDLDNAAAEKFQANFIKRKRSAADSQALIAKSLHTRFALPEAIESFQQAIELAKQGEDENQVAEYQWRLGVVYNDNASYDQAIASYENALNHYSALEGEDSTNVATLRNNLGISWAGIGEYDKAIAYFEKAVVVHVKALGEEHPNVAMNWNNLGAAWADKGEYDKAIAYYEKSLAVDSKVFGEDHPNVARDWANLGIAWRDKGEYDKAIAYYEKSLAVDSKVFGEDHPNVARDWDNLGIAWRDKGEYDKAIAYFDKALTVHRKVFGEGHPDVARDWNNLGIAWANKGEYDKAIAYYDKAVVVHSKVFGETHPDVAMDWNNLGAAWADKGQYDKAIAYYDKALRVLSDKLGNNHPHTKSARDNMEIAKQKITERRKQ